MSEEYVQKQNKKQKFRLPLSAWLSYLVAVTLLLGSVSLAKYTASTTDSSAARVAKFEVSAGPTGSRPEKISLNTVERNTATYPFTVHNTSEVVVTYTVILKNVPKGIDVSFNGGEAIQADDNRTVTYAGEVLKIGEQKSGTVTFQAHDEYAEITDGVQQMTVEVRFIQMD